MSVGARLAIPRRMNEFFRRRRIELSIRPEEALERGEIAAKAAGGISSSIRARMRATPG